ncbi:MFS transporter [Bosea lathyri]|uniref:Predicted arabinose efflux permease, MFS family n=1 Tax=Bosea lathyri TaxID=1036778 RepID=A0A1H6BEG7_9HYPH|nr:MFS transporter [Bosea lathyri]SEG58657.1 Predicted arabinose efflux permease, MFS family [Bosea lathyri]
MATPDTSVQPAIAEVAIATDVPARLDRLPWSHFHTLVVVALGVTWILDGLEVTLAGSVSGALKESPTLRFTNTEIGMAGAAYIAGAVLGALFFGWLTDRLGRKKLFTITLLIYLVATAATAFSWSFASFIVFRFFTGMGIGGEYTAINSTIQELVPARVRGWVDLVINGSFWVGAALGAIGAIVLLDPAHIDPELGWRLAFFIGAALGLIILVLRQWIPESPRWLISHGRQEEATAIVTAIEASAGVTYSPAENLPQTRLRPRAITPLGEVFNTLFVVHRQRALVGLALMVSQAFFYNAIFFTYALILTDFYKVPSQAIGWFILPFAAGNFLGPLILGRLFDTLGRRLMIAVTYALSGLLLTGTGYLFWQDLLTASQLTLCWSVVFFFASAAASSAYLTVSETFPVEMRALAIAAFYAVGTGAGGIAGPWLFGILIDTGSRGSVFAGYVFGAILMLAAAVVASLFAVRAERKPLETVARPLNALD